jgi:hypothetical protein
MSTDAIRLICPNLKCRQILVAPTSARGKAVRCKTCGIRVRVPDAPTAPAKTEGPAAANTNG